jgi:hypothetical protein
VLLKGAEMPRHADRGLVVIDTDQGGTTTVSICARVTDGRPEATFAQYVGSFHVQVHPGVSLIASGASRYSDRIVEVFNNEGAVIHIANPGGISG